MRDEKRTDERRNEREERTDERRYEREERREKREEIYRHMSCAEVRSIVRDKVRYFLVLSCVLMQSCMSLLSLSSQ